MTLNSKFFAIAAAVCLPLLTTAAETARAKSPCGQYTLQGIAELQGTSVHIKTATGTQSETTFVIDLPQATEIYPYLNAPLRAIVTLSQPRDGTRAQVSAVHQAEFRVADPLNQARDSFFEQTTSVPCRRPK